MEILSQRLDDHRADDCLSTVEIQVEIWKSNPKRCRRCAPTAHFKNLINKLVFLAISMQQLFQKALVRECRWIVLRAQLEKYRHRHAPSHPLARIIFQVPQTAQETFHH